MKKLLVLAIAAVMAVGANAQEAYNRVSVGFNMLNLHAESSSIAGTYTNKPNLAGFQVGYTHGFGLIKTCPLYLEVGAKFAYNNGSEKSYTYTSANVNIPVSIAYKFGFGDFWVEPFVGFHGRFNVLGKQKDPDGLKTNLLSKDEADDYRWNVAQIGAQLGVNVGYKMINLGFEYNANSYLNKGDIEGVSIKEQNANWAVTVGYNF